MKRILIVCSIVTGYTAALPPVIGRPFMTLPTKEKEKEVEEKDVVTVTSNRGGGCLLFDKEEEPGMRTYDNERYEMYPYFPESR